MNTVFCAQNLIGNSVGDAYLSHDFFRETTTLNAFTERHSAFSDRVFGIFIPGTEKHVIRTYTTSIVTSMTDFQTIPNDSVVNQPRESMGKNKQSRRECNLPVSCRADYSGPKPTVVCFLNTLPKLFIDGHAKDYSTGAENMVES